MGNVTAPPAAAAAGGEIQVPPPPPGLDPDPVTLARYMVSEKMVALADAINALVAQEAPVPGDISDELRLCQTWANALNAADPPNLPSADQQQPLLDAIQAVESAINNSAAVNQIIAAATTLVNTMKAPGS